MKDLQAYKQLYEAYADLMFSVCYRYVGDYDLSKDLMHDGFVLIFSKIEKFTWRGEGSLKAWVLSIQHNVIISHIRKQHFWKEYVIEKSIEQLKDIPEPETSEDIPSEILIRLISELPTSSRTVFNLYVIEGLSHREIAELLGIQEKSSSSQLSYARKILASRINEWRNRNL